MENLTPAQIERIVLAHQRLYDHKQANRKPYDAVYREKHKAENKAYAAKYYAKKKAERLAQAEVVPQDEVRST